MCSVLFRYLPVLGAYHRLLAIKSTYWKLEAPSKTTKPNLPVFSGFNHILCFAKPVYYTFPNNARKKNCNNNNEVTSPRSLAAA